MHPLSVTRSAQSESETKESEMRQFLTFMLGGETFAIPITQIREIIEFSGITGIPMVPDFLRGVINLRGSVVPVVDLSARLGRGITVTGRRSCVVILEVAQTNDTQCMGVLVDAVSEVITVTPAHIEPRPSFGARIRSEFIECILNIEGRFVISLDVGQVMSVEEMAMLVGVASNGRAVEKDALDARAEA